MPDKVSGNPLGYEPIPGLMRKFAVPSIISMLVSAVYNIVDQFFIGHSVGELGNAATNIAFPLSMACTCIGLMFGIGGASAFNLAMGEGRKKDAAFNMGNSLAMLASFGVLLTVFAEIFIEPILNACGSPAEVYPYAYEYVRYCALGYPFLILTIGGSHLERADGSPRMAMICSISGAVINVFLDAWFVMVLGWGMKGAAIATVAGQIISGLIVIVYFSRPKSVELTVKHFLPNPSVVLRNVSLGAASAINQSAMMIVQISLNNLLKYYGGLSVYGESTPITCSGIVIKVNSLFFAVVIGISQSTQPLVGFNYGAKNYSRVKETYKLAIKAGACVCAVSFTLFQLIPRQLLGIFGTGSDAYFEFGSLYFRIFFAGTIINFVQPLSSSFFTSIGKAYKGAFLSLTRQIIFLLPFLLMFSRIWGIHGILYAGPAADALAFVTAVLMMRREFKIISQLELAQKEQN